MRPIVNATSYCRFVSLPTQLITSLLSGFHRKISIPIQPESCCSLTILTINKSVVYTNFEGLDTDNTVQYFSTSAMDAIAPETHEKWIKRAIQISRDAVSHGNHPFGALLVSFKDGSVVVSLSSSSGGTNVVCMADVSFLFS